MRTRLLLRSLVLAIALVAGALVAGMPADAGPAPVRLPPNSRASFLDSLNTFGMPSHYEGGVASIEPKNQPIHGASATTTVEKPFVSNVDASGFSVSVTDVNDPGNLVRIGWEVNPTDDEYKNEALEPHLFAEHWVGGENRGDEPFVAQPASHELADLLPPGEAHSFKVIRLVGDWWVNLDGEYLGYFPDAEWDGQFTNAIIATWTGMVGTQSDSTCADMGFSGLPGTHPSAALVTLTSVYRVDDLGIHVSPPRQMAGWFQLRPDLYIAGNIDPASQTFRYGGDGYC